MVHIDLFIAKEGRKKIVPKKDTRYFTGAF